MKFKLLILAFLLPLFATAQNNQGTIVYDETIKLQIDIPEEHKEQLKGMFPESRTTKKELIFNSTESIYRDQEGQDNEQVVEAGSEDSGMRMKMVIERPDNQLYKSFKDETVFDKQELFGKDFLVTGEFENLKWKLINESKEIVGYSCQKAIYESEDRIVEAWYTTQIPVNNGPMQYGQLPGMILELIIGEGETHIVASDVQLNTLDKNAIQAPKKGKKVSREEYDKIVAEKQKEMEEEYGNSGGRMIIKHRRN
jgi:GLPGLI family protein